MKSIPYSAILFILLPFSGFSNGYSTHSNTDTVRVANAQEFINAIGSNRVIELSADTFFLDNIKVNESSPTKSKVIDEGIQILKASNLEILGAGTKKKPTVIGFKNKRNTVLTFKECNNIRLVNIEVDLLSTNDIRREAGFLSFEKSENITVINCTLSGNGSFGIICSEAKNLKIRKTTISKTLSAMLILKESSDLVFEDCFFTSNKSNGHLVVSENCHAVQFVKCVFDKNYPDKSSGEYMPEKDFVFLFSNEKPSAGFLLDRCTFPNNKIKKLTNKPEIFTLKETKF